MAKDVTEYRTKAPTDHHKVHARYIVDVVGYDPDRAKSLRAAFLRGVSLANYNRVEFANSE